MAGNRRLWLVAAVVVAAAAIGLTLAFTSAGGSISISTSIPPNVPRLNNAYALATLVALDRRRQIAEFRVLCGWHAAPITYARTRIQPGLYAVSLRGVYFGYHSKRIVTRSYWENMVSRFGWKGLIELEPGPVVPFIFDQYGTPPCSA